MVVEPSDETWWLNYEKWWIYGELTMADLCVFNGIQWGVQLLTMGDMMVISPTVFTYIYIISIHTHIWGYVRGMFDGIRLINGIRLTWGDTTMWMQPKMIWLVVPNSFIHVLFSCLELDDNPN